MSNRREFIGAGTMALGVLTAAGLLPGDSRAQSESMSSQLPPAPLYTVVYDDRFADSVEFGRRSSALGCRTRSLERGDVTRLWYDDLYHRWKQGPAAIAGLTRAEALFVLEGFGNDAGLRLTFKAEHHPRECGVEHRLYGPASLVRAAALQHSGAGWSARVAQLVSHCPNSHVARLQARTYSTFSPPSVENRELLISWVLMPARPPITSA